MAPYEYVDGLAPGPSHGDSVFEHPWVQSLLQAARGRVKQALDQQPGLQDDKWLICIRTFGRAGARCQQSELHRFLYGVLDRQAARIMEEKLKAADLSLFDLRLLAKKPLHTFQDALREAGVVRLTSKTAKILADNMCQPLETVEKKLYTAEKGLRELTLAALELALGPEAYKHCLIFVSHTDSAWISGNYAAALSGTPWADRVVVGIRGAHLQVRFIEEAAPKGSHIVIMDDNIERLVVEIADDSIVAQRKAAGITDNSTWPLNYKDGLSPLNGTGLIAVEEPDLLCFLRGLCPELEKMKKMTKVQETLRKIQVTCLQEFKDLPVQRVDAALQEAGLSQKKRRKCIEAAKDTAFKPLPPRLLTKPARKGLKLPGEKPELSTMIRRAGNEMKKHGVHIWGVNPSRNHFYLRNYGVEARRRAVSTGIFRDYSMRLGLVYGAWFGIRVQHNPRLYTRGGQIKDDVERTLRYWHADKRLLRFMRYGADKRSFKPGQFSMKKGGISATSSLEKHSAEAQAAVTSLVNEFGAYVRFPKAHEKSSCGLVWSQPIKKRRKPMVDPPESKRSKLGC